MKERVCYECGRQITFTGFLEANRDKSRHYLEKLWKCKYIELLCCVCFSFKTEGSWHGIISAMRARPITHNRPIYSPIAIYGDDSTVPIRVRLDDYCD